MNNLEIWLTTFGTIFAVIDPFGYVPIFLSMTSGDTQAQRNRMVSKACFASFIILGISATFGQSILHFFGISIPALQISGGLILLIIGFEMMKVLPVVDKLSHREETEAVRKDDISIVPLAIPMLAGPASIATMIILSSNVNEVADYGVIFACVILNLVIVYLVLSSSTRLMKIIGLTGLNVMTRVMGLLLCAIAVQHVISGYLAVKP